MRVALRWFVLTRAMRFPRGYLYRGIYGGRFLLDKMYFPWLRSLL